MSSRSRPYVRLAAVLCLVLSAAVAQAAGPSPALPPADGASEPRVVPLKGEDGLYHQSWFVSSFLDLKEDHAEAKAKGKRFAVIFEQRGCVYCTKMHTEVMAHRYINDYVRESFAIVQLDLWGSREVTDFDGTRLPEKKLAERWGVLFTPTVVFFKDDLTPVAGKWGAPLEVARLPLGFGPATFYDLFVWVKTKSYETDPNFQRFHIARMNEREAAKAASGKK
jgi:thioredoxin-related protein